MASHDLQRGTPEFEAAAKLCFYEGLAKNRQARRVYFAEQRMLAAPPQHRGQGNQAIRRPRKKSDARRAKDEADLEQKKRAWMHRDTQRLRRAFKAWASLKQMPQAPPTAPQLTSQPREGKGRTASKRLEMPDEQMPPPALAGSKQTRDSPGGGQVARVYTPTKAALKKARQAQAEMYKSQPPLPAGCISGATTSYLRQDAEEQGAPPPSYEDVRALLAQHDG